MNDRLIVSEAQWQSRVIDYARLRGWMVSHQRPARTERGWVTATEGDPGFPDLVFARRGVVIFAELKSEAGRVSHAQERWLRELGDNAYLWKPSHWEFVQEVLK